MTQDEIVGLRARLAAGSGEMTDPLRIANAILDNDVSHPDPDDDMSVLARQVIRRTEILHRVLDALDALHAKIAELEGERDAASARVGEMREALERIATPMPGCAWAATERQEIAERAISDGGKS